MKGGKPELGSCSRREAMRGLAGLAGLALAGGVCSAGASTEARATDHTRPNIIPSPAGEPAPIRSRAEWAKRRAQILHGMQEVMGPLPGLEHRVPLALQVMEEVASESFTRKRITFSPEANDQVPAYLFIPKRVAGRCPAVLCLHQTTRIGKGEPSGLGGLPNLHYARELAERGYVTLAPDYPNFGDYAFKTYERGYTSGSMKAIWNNMRAVDLLQSLPQVDPAHIGCIGHSLGGHNTMFTAVFDERIKAMVSSCGFTAFGAYYAGDLTGWTGATYMPRIKDRRRNDGWAKYMPFDFHEVVAAFAPRAFFTNSPLRDSNFEVRGVREVIDRARPIYELFGASEKLVAVYPDAEHDFPPSQRSLAYDFLDRWLRRSPTKG